MYGFYGRILTIDLSHKEFSVEPLADDHVLTLYRGGDLARELLSEGYTSISEIPDSRLPHQRQLIQKASLTSSEPHTDKKLLNDFLSSLRTRSHACLEADASADWSHSLQNKVSEPACW